MSAFWIVVLATVAANVYLLTVWLMARSVFDWAGDRWRALFSVLWPAMFPLFVLFGVVMLLGKRGEQ